MKNIITISGDPASGKSTCIKGLKERFEKQGYKVEIFSAGKIMRSLAEKRGMTIGEFSVSLEDCKGKDPDLIMEDTVKKLGQEIEQKQEENTIYIIDARMAWWCIPSSFKITLKTDSKVGGKRVFDDTTRGEEDKYETLEDAIKATQKRKDGDRRKYSKKYGVDIADPNNFDLVIDTSYAKTEDTLDCAFDCFEKYKKGEYFNKSWTSPETLVPVQNIRETFESIEEVKASIKQCGYDQEELIEVIDVNGIPYILNGHNRTFAAHQLGMTLVPYTVVAKDDELIPDYSQMTARRLVTDEYTHTVRGIFYCGSIYDHEDAFFRDENIYNETGLVTNGHYGKIYGKEIYKGELLKKKRPETPGNPKKLPNSEEISKTPDDSGDEQDL